ncbi:MAG: TRAP transporter small permease [Deltaproteobacteria bacterium]|nr:TRAP transporter small permease [Deltaproteobacteria bacterium]
MQALLNALEAASKTCNRIARFLLVTLSVAMVTVVFVHLVFRFLVKIPLPWSGELARYLMVWVAMMGAPVALYEGRHIGVAYLMAGLRRRLQLALMTISLLGILWFLYLLVREGSSLALGNWGQKSPVMMIPMFFPYAAVPLGGGMMIIQILRRLARVVINEHPEEGTGGSERC